MDSSVVYGRSYGMLWICQPCDAYVGTHRNSKDHKPLGRLANAELREWKIRAHDAFDPLWRAKMQRDKYSKSKARRVAYHWLAGKLGIGIRNCHIGMFDIDQCRHTVEVCLTIRRKR